MKTEVSAAEKFVFSNQWQQRLLRHTAFWLMWLIFHGVIYGSYWRNLPPSPQSSLVEVVARSLAISFSEALMFMPTHFFLSYSIIYFLIPRYLFKRQYAKLLVGFIVLLVLAACLSHLTAITLIKGYRTSIGLPNGTNTILFGLMAGLRGSNTVAGFAAAIKLIKYWYLKNEENQQLEKEKLQAELQSLRNQLHPHFLFNTLNSLYSLTLQNSSKAPQMIVRLSELLRYVLTESRKTSVELARELGLINNYVELEKIRFGERLNVTIHVEGSIEDVQVTPLLLLPFLENSFKHGIRSRVDDAWISIYITVTEGELLFKMVNSKSKGETLMLPSTGIGLQNIRRRLQLLYPRQHELRVTEGGDTYVVTLRIQIRNAKKIPNGRPYVEAL